MKLIIYITSNKTQIQEMSRLFEFISNDIKFINTIKILYPHTKLSNYFLKILWTIKTILTFKRNTYILISNTERVTGFEGLLLSKLSKKSFYHIFYQISKTDSKFDKNFKRINKKNDNKFVLWLAKKLYPSNFSNNLSFFSNKEVFFKFFNNTLLINPWIEGSTLIDEFWIHDNASRKIYEKSQKKMTLLGSLQKNELFLNQKKRKIKNKVAFAIPHLFEHKLMTKKDADNELNKIKDIFLKFDGNLEFVACLHPKQNKTDYLWMNEKNIMLSDKSLLNEIVDSECLICAFRSVTDWAKLLKIPTIQLDYLAFGLSTEANGIFNTNNTLELEDYLNELNKNKLKVSRIDEELLPFDDRIKERIENRLLSIINHNK